MIFKDKWANFTFLTFTWKVYAGGSSLAAMKRILRPGAAWDHLGYGLTCLPAMTPRGQFQYSYWNIFNRSVASEPLDFFKRGAVKRKET